MSLRMGSHGPDVAQVQQMLIRLGADIQPDGYFGALTDRAVRVVKRRLGLFPPDGRLGQRAMRALQAADDDPAADRIAQPVGTAHHTDMSFEPDDIGGCVAVENDVHLARAWARSFPDIFDLPSSPATMNTTVEGRRFIELEEEGPTTHLLHFPGGGSGVTLGPGYDMRGKTSSEIVRDLVRIGVPRAAATTVSGASTLHGRAAADFVSSNQYVVDLSREQQAALLATTIGKYEAMIQNGVTVPLYKHEFNALVSFAYNPGKALPGVLSAINAGRVAEAMTLISHVVTSGGVVMRGLVNRRKGEIALYLYGKYHA